MSNDHPQQTARGPQFTLRALLLAVTVCGVGLGWLGVKVRQARRQREAAARFMDLGASLGYDRGDRGNVVSIHFSDYNELSDDDLQHISALPRLHTLWLNISQVTDRGLAHLAAAPALEELHLNTTHVSDTGIKHLARLPALERIVVCGAGPADAPQIEKLRQALPEVTVEVESP